MRTDTGLRDSYNEPIYEGDALYDEVGNFYNYIVKHNGRWYAAANPHGDVLRGSIEGGYGRRCQVIHTDAETVVELWKAHRNRDRKEEQLKAELLAARADVSLLKIEADGLRQIAESQKAKITGLENLIEDLQHDNGMAARQVGALLTACEVAYDWLDGLRHAKNDIITTEHYMLLVTLQAAIEKARGEEKSPSPDLLKACIDAANFLTYLVSHDSNYSEVSELLVRLDRAICAATDSEMPYDIEEGNRDDTNISAL